MALFTQTSDGMMEVVGENGSKKLVVAFPGRRDGKIKLREDD